MVQSLPCPKTRKCRVGMEGLEDFDLGLAMVGRGASNDSEDTILSLRCMGWRLADVFVLLFICLGLLADLFSWLCLGSRLLADLDFGLPFRMCHGAVRDG